MWRFSFNTRKRMLHDTSNSLSRVYSDSRYIMQVWGRNYTRALQLVSTPGLSAMVAASVCCAPKANYIEMYWTAISFMCDQNKTSKLYYTRCTITHFIFIVCM